MTVNTKDLTITRSFNASINQVFKAWTDPELLTKWWGPYGVSIPKCDIDLKPGGLIDIVMLAGKELGELAGNEWPMSGIYQEINPPNKLVYTSSAIVDGKPILDCLNTVLFEEVDGKTQMTLTIKVTRTAAEAEGPLAGMEMGWTQSIDKLVELSKSW